MHTSESFIEEDPFEMIRIGFLSLIFIMISCSSGEQVEKKYNDIGALDDGLFLRESGEDDVVELVVPEVEEYSELKKEVDSEALRKISLLASSDVGIEEVENIERKIATIGDVDSNEVQEEVIAEDRFEKYIVQKDDSMMMISYRIYGTIKHWVELAKLNGITPEIGYKIIEGTELKFKVRDSSGNEWKPEGSPYLVRHGDYLGNISKKVYKNNARFWYDIWKNNEALIHDPNKIYVGFTIYYESIETVYKNEQKRIQMYKDKFGTKPVQMRDLAGKLDSSAKIYR